MKTVIFTREVQEDIYNDETVMERIWNGERVVWKLWYSGDARCRPTQAESGDRFFIAQKGTEIVASGTVGTITFEPSTSKLVKCGMNLIELIPDRVGRPMLDGVRTADVLSRAKVSNNQKELVLPDCQTESQIEILWILAELENNTAKDQLTDNMWAVDNLHPQTVTAIRGFLMFKHGNCPGCGSSLKADDSLFYCPSLKNDHHNGLAKTFPELIERYSVLCADCAAIEKNLH